MYSMTGFGKADTTSKFGRVTVEVSGVNSRFLEVSSRLPRQYSLLEHKLRELLTARLNRGKITVYVGIEEKEDAPGRFQLNHAAVKAYHRQLTELQKTLRLGG
ncbi:MAG TPA: YicC/YloC family endoribonuclease, partial [Candidatus Deferrimicrobium sp.]|nr:YicC/YloC family endoribonuclease [Candidatus Deferrimicrobium sp.]